MDLDFDDTLLRGLRQYVGLVSTAMNMGRGYACLQAERPATAYLPLDGRLPGHPDRDVALLWEESRGWTAVVERLSGVDLTVVAEMGGPVLPAPAAVANWVREVRRGLVGRRRSPIGADVSAQLASYALAAAG